MCEPLLAGIGAFSPDQARDPARWLQIYPSSTILESNPNHRQAMKPSNYRDRWMMNAAGSAQFPGNPRLFPKPQGHGAPSVRAAGSPQHLQHLGPGSQVLPCDKPALPFAFHPVKYRSYFLSTSPAAPTQPNGTSDFLPPSDPGEMSHMRPPSGRAISFLWLGLCRQPFDAVL